MKEIGMDNPGFQPDAEAALARSTSAAFERGGATVRARVRRRPRPSDATRAGPVRPRRRLRQLTDAHGRPRRLSPQMDNPGFQPDAEAALAHAHGQGLALPNNRRAPTADRRSLKNSRRQQQQQQQQQRVFSVSCRALDVPPPIPPPAAPIHNNNAGEAKAAAAAAATSDTSAAAWAREGAGAGAGACGLARLGCGRRRWELRPSQPPPPLLLGLLVAAAAALALVAVAAVLAASSVLDSPASPSPAVEVEPTTLVRGEFRLQPPPLHARPRSRPHHPPARGGSAATTGAEDEAAEEEEEEAAALSAAAVAALLSRVFRNFPRFAAAAATVQLAGDGAGAGAGAGAGEGAEAEGVVRCELTFRAPAGAALAPRVGLHFLGALRARAGRLWLLGRLPVDPRSVAFEEVGDGLFAAGDASQPYTAEAESSTSTEAATTTTTTAAAAAAPMAPPPDAAWGAWSAWGPCGAGGTQRRSRPCLAGARGAPLADSEPCLLLPGGGGDLEVRDCRRRDAAGVTVDALLGGVTRMQRLREAPAPPPTAPAPADDSAPLAPPALALTLGPRRCDACLPGEVCVALAGETLPACRPPADAADPTGCGGLCRLGRDLCHRLDRDAFRCVEDSPCLAEEWRCGNLLCIPRVKRCDGHLNCYDHTDEFDCECDLETHFHCGNGTSCLPRSKRCDHIIDCWDGTDELNCTQACPRADQFTCSDGQCIPRVRFCDGLADCHDQSDEPFGCGGACKRHEWRCGNGRCVKKAAVCDGADDCGDETDEANCSPSRLRLRASQPLVNAK